MRAMQGPPTASAEQTASDQPLSRAALLAVIVAALGYLVDIYDLILFGVIRDASLEGIGVALADRARVGENLMSIQMAGMLLGGIVWGILGDKRGRLSVLFGSILLYSLANIANGFVTDVTTYGVLRFVAGVGLAGELGAGITLVTELIDKRRRGLATTVVAGVGICGAILAGVVGRTFEWQTAYWIGGVMGLLLLCLRLGVLESGIFARVKASDVSRGNFFALFATASRRRRYVSIILAGVPVWYGVGLLAIGSPEITGALGVDPLPVRGTAIVCMYTGLAMGDFGSGIVSQLLKSRRKAILAFLALNVGAIAFYFLCSSSATLVYVACFLLGIANGYWAVFVTTAAEQFGTNLRATAATTAPNFVRGSLTLMTFLFHALAETLSLPMAALAVGVLVIGLAFLSVLGIEETFGKDLDFVEE
jgi:predicted MFS family arabinose efflux permease